MTPDGTIPDFGDVRWLDSSEAYIYCLEKETGKNTVRFGVVNAINLVYQGNKLFEVPEAPIGQFDGTIRMVQTSWNRYEGESECDYSIL